MYNKKDLTMYSRSKSLSDNYFITTLTFNHFKF